MKKFHVMAPITDMMRSFNQEVGHKVRLPAEDTRTLRRELLKEEYEEYLHAEQEDDLVEIADALADMIVIISGTAAAYGIDLDEVLAEVHQSNMAKINPETGMVLRREDGKVLKPQGWEPPNVRRVLDEQGSLVGFHEE